MQKGTLVRHTSGSTVKPHHAIQLTIKEAAYLAYKPYERSEKRVWPFLIPFSKLPVPYIGFSAVLDVQTIHQRHG